MGKKNRNRPKDQEVVRKDTSVHVPQKDKIKTELSIRDLPWTIRQKEFIQLLQDKNTNVILCSGPAGVGKTLLSIYCGLQFLNQKKIGEIIYIRAPVESSSHGLGFIKGDQNEKMLPYVLPCLDKLDELLPPSQVNLLMNEQKVRGIPIGYLRGLSLSGALIYGDEMQSCTVAEHLTLMSRVGKFSKLVLGGDMAQADIKNSGFEIVYNMFDTDEAKKHGIHTFKFGLEDIMRSPTCRYIVETFENYKKSQNAPKAGDWSPKSQK